MRSFALLIVFAAAALAQKITMEFDQDADFTQYKTFFMNTGQLNSKNAALNNDIIRKKIQDDVRQQLLAKGLTEVTSGARDLNVRFSLGSSRRKEVDVYPARWWGYRRVVSNYTEGTLVLDLRDPKQQMLVWRAIAVEDKSDAPHIESKLDDMVKKSFQQYPPKKK
jgi:Domain of unknown function (DUF4136)